MSEAIDAALAVAEAVPEGARAVLIGGLAANIYRKVRRLTVDADVIVWGEGLRSAAALERALIARGFARPPGRRVYRAGRFEWRRLLWPGDDPEEPAVVDLFLGGGFLADAVDRARPAEVRGRTILVASPEDIVVFKLLAISSGASVRGHKLMSDEDDVRSILASLSDTIDADYIREQASTVGALRLANRYLRAAGI